MTRLALKHAQAWEELVQHDVDRIVMACAAMGYVVRDITAFEAWARHCGGPGADWIDTRALGDDQIVRIILRECDEVDE